MNVLLGPNATNGAVMGLMLIFGLGCGGEQVPHFTGSSGERSGCGDRSGVW